MVYSWWLKHMTMTGWKISLNREMSYAISQDNKLQSSFIFMLPNFIYITHTYMLYKNIYKNSSKLKSKKGRGRYCIFFRKLCVHINSSFKYIFIETINHLTGCKVKLNTP